MRNVFLTSVIMMTVLLTACNEEVVNYKYKFKGEGEYWEAEYLFEGTETWKKADGSTAYSNSNTDVFQITYKGSIEELQAIKQLEYSYETSAGGGGGTREFDTPPTDSIFKSGGSGTGAKVNENDIISVNIKWDGYEKTFELTDKNK